jgi:hypothetical protein
MVEFLMIAERSTPIIEACGRMRVVAKREAGAGSSTSG